jgi:hypothetical protein
MKLTLMISGLAVLALLPLASTPQGRFTAKSLTRTGSFRLEAAPEKVFPLFGPVREKEWADGWNPTILYPADAEVAENMVFTVPHGKDLTIWTIAAYDPTRRAISYINVTPEVRLVRVDVRCEPAGADTTDVHVTYTYTGLSDEGNSIVENYTAKTHSDRMEEWGLAINHYLKTGKRLESGKAE